MNDPRIIVALDFNSATDANGSVALLRFWDSTPGAGHLVLDGVAVTGEVPGVPVPSGDPVDATVSSDTPWPFCPTNRTARKTAAISATTTARAISTRCIEFPRDQMFDSA